MKSRIAVIVIDCQDSERVAAFWKAALGYETEIHREEDGAPWIKLRDPDGQGPPIAIDPVPEGKVVKNRVHLDLMPPGTLADEVERLKGLGAQEAHAFIGSHVVMHDPEGNEFCVLDPAPPQDVVRVSGSMRDWSAACKVREC